ncbi:hypothetical protein SDC9_49371 [bioreactor metagenome]|uniref:Uncharacterized protein n=1 Tax=bioreactor metagenome TaxID=1076179 RepID=A0A644WI04_9ZZZZ
MDALLLSSLILLLLLLPALIFRSLIIKSEGLENPLDTSLKAEIGIVLFISIILHLIGIFVLNWLDAPFNFYNLFQILIGNSISIKEEIINNSLIPFLIYILVQIIFGAILSLFLKKICLKYYLDIKYDFLPISNNWDNLLSGRVFELERIRHINSKILELKNFQRNIFKQIRNKEIDLSKKEVRRKIKEKILELKSKKKIAFNCVELDVLVQTSLGDVIYKGKIHKYYLSKDNSLDKVVLTECLRRKFCNGSIKNKGKFHFLDSKLFVINHSEMKNLNIRYSIIEEKI